MAERLGEVAEQFTGRAVDLFGEQPDIVDVGDGTFEDDARPLELIGQCQRVREPEGAEQEGPLFAFETVMRSVAVYEASFVGESLFGRVDRGQDAGIDASSSSDPKD